MKYVPPNHDELRRRGIDPKTMTPITKTATTQKPAPKSRAGKRAKAE